MDPTAPPPDPHCTRQYTVEALHAVGVATSGSPSSAGQLSSSLVATSTSSSNSKTANAAERASSLPESTSPSCTRPPIYTIVQVADFREKNMKPISSMIVFLIIYEQIFYLAKSGLTFEFLGHCCGITSPNIMLAAAGAVAIAEGGQWRALGITDVVVSNLFSNSIFSQQVSEGDEVCLIEAAAIKFSIIYPAILAAIFTMVASDRGVWIPKPESAVEYIMLVTRGIATFGGVDVLAAIVSSIYRLIVKDAKVCPDVKPAFNWYCIRLGGIFGQARAR